MDAAHTDCHKGTQTRRKPGRGTAVIVSVAVLLLLVLRVHAELPISVRTTTGEGGLVVQVVEMPQAPTVAVRLYLMGGAYAETGRRGAGIANAARAVLMESYRAAMLDAPATSMPVRIASRTDDDAVCFWVTTTADHLDEALRALARLVSVRTVDDALWRRVRARISSQLAARDQDAAAVAVQSLRRAAYAWHPARYPTRGDQAAFLTLEKADVERYLQANVGAGNMMLVVAGDLAVAHVQAALADAFVNVPRTPVSTRDTYALTPCTAPRWVDDAAAVLRHHVLVGYVTTLRGARDEAALEVAAALLEQRLPLLARRAWAAAGAPQNDQCPLTLRRLAIPRAQRALVVRGDADQNKAARVAQQLAQELEHAAQTITTDEEVRALAQQLQARRLARVTQPARAARWVGDAALRAGNPAYALEYAEMLGGVTRAQVLQVWAEYICAARRTTVVLVPEEGLKPAALAARDNMAVAERQLVRTTLYPVRRVMLENGCTLLLRRTTAEPVVRVQFACIGGLWCELPANNGVFTVLGRAMCQATRMRDRVQFAAHCAQAGLTLAAETGPQTFALRATVLPEHLADALAVLCAAWRMPLLDKQTVNDLTARLLQELQRQHTSTRALADIVACDTLFAQPPYQLNPLGSVASLNALTWGDVADIHNDFVTPRGTVIIISGAFDDHAVEQQLRLLLRAFADKKKSQYFAAHHDRYRVHSTPPFITVALAPEPAGTAAVTRVFAARRPDTLVISGSLAPARTASNAPPRLADVVCGALRNALDTLQLTWRDLDGLPIVRHMATTSYSGYDAGWLYLRLQLDASAGMPGVRRVQMVTQAALRDLGEGTSLTAAIERAELEHARRMSEPWQVLDELVWNQLFGQAAVPVTAWRAVTAKECAAFMTTFGKNSVTAVITPE